MYQDEVDFYLANKEALADLPNPNLLHVGALDFDNLTREETVKVLERFPGKWRRIAEGDRMTYVNTSSNLPMGLQQIRIWRGTPPPSCRVVETIEEVPATTRIVRTLVCDKEVE